MAKANWLVVNPSSGSGNGTVNMSTSSPHTGRMARTTTPTFKASGVTDVVVTANQAGKPEFVSISENATVSKEGGTVTISGKSNSTKLIFALGTGSLVFTLPDSYTANSVLVNNNTVIVGDPGATAEFNFSISLSIPANTGITELIKQVLVTDAAGHVGICNLTQAADDPTLSVSPSTVDLTWEGVAVSVTVTSNTNWSVV